MSRIVLTLAESTHSDGVRQHSSGFLIAKPCTAQEIAFYESSVYHPAFAKYMPTLIGTLTSASSQTPGLETAKVGATTALTTSLTSSAVDSPAALDIGQQPGVVPISNPLGLQDSPWV